MHFPDCGIKDCRFDDLRYVDWLFLLCLVKVFACVCDTLSARLCHSLFTLCGYNSLVRSHSECSCSYKSQFIYIFTWYIYEATGLYITAVEVRFVLFLDHYRLSFQVLLLHVCLLSRLFSSVIVICLLAFQAVPSGQIANQRVRDVLWRRR
jgi:hypothetical protein